MITLSTHRLASNAVELFVTGKHLPPSCPASPKEISIGGLSTGSQNRANLTLGTHYTLFGCTTDGFTLRLIDTMRWHPNTAGCGDGCELRMLHYASSGPIDVPIATVMPPFDGNLMSATADVVNTGILSILHLSVEYNHVQVAASPFEEATCVHI